MTITDFQMPFAVPINLSCSADSNIHIKELYVRKAVSIITLVDSPTQLNLYFGSIFDTSCYVNMYVYKYKRLAGQGKTSHDKECLLSGFA